MPTVTSHDGIPLFYEIHDYTDPWKNAPTLILQHGFGRSGRFWYNMIPYLSRFYKVLCPTLRGLGTHYDMPNPDQSITAENYIKDLITILDHLGLDRCRLRRHCDNRRCFCRGLGNNSRTHRITVDDGGGFLFLGGLTGAT